ERVSAQRSANDSLQQDVAAEVSSLESQVASSASLDDLKQHMRSRIAAIASRIRSFRETEDEKLAAAEQRNAELTTELSTLKSRTEMLSEQLEQQQALLLLDSLTQVHSRFAYERRMREEFASFERTSHPVSYTIWDIDHFKQINDSFGHQAGDNVLRSVAGYLSRYTRADDFVARIGGEEFVILLPGTDQKNALVIAEKLRALIAAAEFPMDGEVHSITISCGVAQLRAGDTLESVYDRADQALYAAKHAGRNCCKAA
ncbi:MAG: diguanylate cyclase, partial [Pseudomonadota bacterium]